MFLLFDQREKVGLVHLVQEVDDIVPLRRPVDDDVEVVTGTALDHDKLLIFSGLAVNIVHQGHVALRGQGLGLHTARNRGIFLRFIRKGVSGGGTGGEHECGGQQQEQGLKPSHSCPPFAPSRGPAGAVRP